ncbi:hypothetical protein C8Q77DRAFT_840025 [Trametes polyzona]|nr:hypothetical protein C8Q77DRAFT_840025 [Trametes polyzona]
MPPSAKPRRNDPKRCGKRAKPYPKSRPLENSAHTNIAPNQELSSSSATEPKNPEKEAATKKGPQGNRPIRRDLGMPSREEYAAVEAEYLASLDYRKKTKALISQEMFDNILLVLRFPNDISIETPQFRWWVRKMFRLDYDASKMRPSNPAPWEVKNEYEGEDEDVGSLVIIHDGKRVAVKEEIYDILCFCHARVDHGGRDRTAAEIRKEYTWVPKELIAGFVKNCPTCVCKKTGKFDEMRVVTPKMEHSEIEARLADEYGGVPQADGHSSQEGSAANVGADSRLPLVPPSHLLPNPYATMGSVPLVRPNGGYLGVGAFLNPVPGLIPWYMGPPPQAGPLNADFGSNLGLGPGPRAMAGSFSQAGGPSLQYPSWQFPGPSAATMAPHHQHPTREEHVRLPSIHPAHHQAFQPPIEGPKVTLPSLAHLLANEQMAPRQPFGALQGNASPQLRWDPLGPPVPHIKTQPMPAYVPQIDPALLPDGVHMLALAAEAAQARDAAGNAPFQTV